MRLSCFLCIPFLLDRMSKQWVYTYTSDYILNRGIAWSFFHSESMLWYLFISLSVGVMSLVLIQIYRSTPGDGYLMMISGALSNLCDRCLYGGVLDFIHLSYKGWSWPLFNLADLFIVIGFFMVWYQRMRYYEKMV